jgi:hypothetical protein
VQIRASQARRLPLKQFVGKAVVNIAIAALVSPHASASDIAISSKPAAAILRRNRRLKHLFDCRRFKFNGARCSILYRRQMKMGEC